MGTILGSWRIAVAALFSLVLVGGAYYLAWGTRLPQAEASAESELLKAIASRDTDADELPDWEEALYGTDPALPDSFKLGMNDGEAVAKGLIVPKAISEISVATSAAGVSVDGLPAAPAEDTLTAAFAENFFTLYLAAKRENGGEDLSEAQLQEVATKAVQSLAASVAPAPDFKSMSDLNVSGSGAESLRAFAPIAEAVFLANTSTGAESEIIYLKQALEAEDSAPLAHIASKAKAYRGTAAGLAVLPVPKEIVGEYLALINALMKVSRICDDFAQVNEDPLSAMLALQQYPDAVLALGQSFVKLGSKYRTAGILLSGGEPGASFVNLMWDVAAEQEAAKKKP